MPESLIFSLLEKVRAVSLEGRVCPDFPEVEEGDTVVGTVPDDLKRLYFLQEDLWDREIADFVSKVRSANISQDDPDEKVRLLIGEAERLDTETYVLKLCFEFSLRHLFADHVLRLNKLGIRKDWKMVVVPSNATKGQLAYAFLTLVCDLSK